MLRLLAALSRLVYVWFLGAGRESRLSPLSLLGPGFRYRLVGAFLAGSFKSRRPLALLLSVPLVLAPSSVSPSLLPCRLSPPWFIFR